MVTDNDDSKNNSPQEPQRPVEVPRDKLSVPEKPIEKRKDTRDNESYG